MNCKGKKLGSASAARRARISRANKGKIRNWFWITNGLNNKQWQKDKPIPEGYKKGRVMGKEFATKAILSHKGLKDSEETKKKKSEARKKYLKTGKNNNAIEIIDLNTGKLFRSLKEALQYFNFKKRDYLKFKDIVGSDYFRLKPFHSSWTSYATLSALPLLELSED